MKHPNVGLTTDGHGKPYEHGTTEYSVGTITFADAPSEGDYTPGESDDIYELLSDEDLEEIFSNDMEE